jgi:hypothetical protein
MKTLLAKIKSFNIPFRDALYVVLIAVLMLALFRQGQATSRAEGEAHAQTEAVERFKNREGQYVARIRTLGDVRGLLASQDSLLRKIAATATKNTHTATVFTTVTKVQVAGKTDTVRFTVNQHPEYRATIARPWAMYQLRMNQDSAFLWSETRNEFLVNTHRVRFGFLNLKSKLVTDVTSTNPDTGVEELRSYAPVVKDRNLVVGPFVGLGIGPNLTPSPYVGVGLTYRLFAW